MIKFYQSNNEQYGYNHSIGGESGANGYKFTYEQKKKLSEIRTGKKNPNCGRCQKGKLNNMYGKHHTKQAKRKISAAQYNPVVQYDKQGNFIAEYSNTYQAELQTKILHIRECCIGIRKTAGNYYWKYKLKKQQAEDDW